MLEGCAGLGFHVNLPKSVILSEAKDYGDIRNVVIRMTEVSMRSLMWQAASSQ
jgi:hypothetical protein